MTAYVVVALCAGHIVSILLQPLSYSWHRFAIVAVTSTCLGMIVSWRLTNALFPDRSGRVVFATFAAVVLTVGIAGRTDVMNWLHIGQALLLVALAFGLFWPHSRLAR